MKKIYRKLFEFFSWLAWVTGIDYFQVLAIRLYFRSTYIWNAEDGTIISNVDPFHINK